MSDVYMDDVYLATVYNFQYHLIGNKMDIFGKKLKVLH
jgi:hypothetical protein